MMTETSTDSFSDNTEAKKPVKELPVVHDEGAFRHETGDVYDGFFEVKKKDRIAKMHGAGQYTTAEGDTYLGTWDGDRLGGSVVTVGFTDGSRYEGHFKNWSYAGRGKYHYPDGSVLECDFTDSVPVGALTLTDPNEHVWLGTAEQGFGWFEPQNHFYEILETRVQTRRGGKVSP